MVPNKPQCQRSGSLHLHLKVLFVFFRGRQRLVQVVDDFLISRLNVLVHIGWGECVTLERVLGKCPGGGNRFFGSFFAHPSRTRSQMHQTRCLIGTFVYNKQGGDSPVTFAVLLSVRTCLRLKFSSTHELTLVYLGQELLLDNVELLGDRCLPSPNVGQINIVILSQFHLNEEGGGVVLTSSFLTRRSFARSLHGQYGATSTS